MDKSSKHDNSWYINRLKLMSVSEILDRLGELSYQFYERHSKKSKKFNYKYKGTGNFILNSKDIVLLRKFYEQNSKQKENLINSAENILGHRFSYFMLNNFYFGEKINWHKDYPNNKVCEYKFYADVKYKDYKKNGDVKYIWEQNRFLHLYKLAQATLITSQPKYARGIVNQIESWIDDNPYLLGINWVSSLEVSIRLISWSFAFASLKLLNYKADKPFEDKFLQSVYQHLDYLTHHLSKGSSANNHIIGEAAGLVVAGCVFDFGNDSKKWIKQGIKILESEIVKQTSEEGLDKEQSVSYHLFSFDFFLCAYLYASKNGYKFSSKYLTRLKKMAEVIIDFSDSKFTLPNIGDSDEGIVLKLSNNPESNQVVSLFDTSAIIFNEAKFKYKSGVDEKTLWLLGYEGLEKFSKAQISQKPKTSKYLKSSGYYVFKDEDKYAVMDVGNLGYSSISAHGHSDALAFLLSYKGKEFLVDSGTYVYNTNPEWRAYFKGTSAHNTVCVDKKDQSLSGGNFMWLTKAEVKVENVKTTSELDYISAFQDGYIKQQIGAKHTREVLFKKGDYFIIVDKINILDKKAHNVDLNWHFASECDISQVENTYKILNAGVEVNATILSSSPAKMNIFKGSEIPQAGWISKKYDFRLIAPTLNVNIKSPADVTFVTLIGFENEFKQAVLTDTHLEYEYKGAKNVISLDSLNTLNFSTPS